MLVPVAAETRFSTIPWVVFIIMAANVVVFCSGETLHAADPWYHLAYGYVPFDPRAVTLISSMFLHANLIHLVGNLLFLWIFGPAVEHSLGHGKFAGFYLAGGSAATLFHGARIPEFLSDLPLIGASGAVAAVMGAFFVFHPRLRIRCILFYGIFQRVSLPASVVLALWMVLQLIQSNYLLEDAVAYEAHIGGFLAGFAVAVMVKHGWDIRRVFGAVRLGQAVDELEERLRDAEPRLRLAAVQEAVGSAAAVPPAVAYWHAVSALRAGRPETVRTVLGGLAADGAALKRALRLNLVLLRDALGLPPSHEELMLLGAHLEECRRAPQVVAMIDRVLAAAPAAPYRAQLLYRKAQLCANQLDRPELAREIYEQLAASEGNGPIGEAARFELKRQRREGETPPAGPS